MISQRLFGISDININHIQHLTEESKDELNSNFGQLYTKNDLLTFFYHLLHDYYTTVLQILSILSSDMKWLSKSLQRRV